MIKTPNAFRLLSLVETMKRAAAQKHQRISFLRWCLVGIVSVNAGRFRSDPDISRVLTLHTHTHTQMFIASHVEVFKTAVIGPSASSLE